MFQKNLVVWKPAHISIAGFLNTEFQKNLVVWKQETGSFDWTRKEVSEELSSVETEKKSQEKYQSRKGFRRT